MLINRLQLDNFKIFYGKNTLEFKPGSDNVVVIQGDNGHGKTTLMDSIFWVLYGKERKHDKLLSPKFTKLVNTHAKAQNDHHCSVSINFDHDGKHYFMQRSLRSKRKRGAPTTNKHFNQEVKFRINGRSELDVDAIITEIFPPDIATFFFFDGETISRYAETYTSNKDTIEKALGLPYLKRAKEDVGKLKKDYERSLRGIKVSPSIERLEKEIEVLDKRREDKGKMLQISEKILTNLNNEKVKMQRALDEFEELKAVHDRISDLEEFNSELDKEEEVHKKQEAEFKAAIPSLIVRTLLREAVENVGDIKEQSITDRINQGRLLDQREFLDHLLTTGICVCGQEFTETSLTQLRSMVSSLKERLSGIHPVATDRYGWTQGDMADAMLRVKTLEREMVNLPRLEAKRNYIDENRTRIAKALAKEHRNLSAHSAQNKREKEVFDRLSKLTQDRAIYHAKLSDIKDDLEAIERRQLDQEVQLRKALERQNLDTLRISREIDLIDRVTNAFQDIIERSAEIKRKKIQKKGSKIFHEITNKPKEFVGLHVDEDTFEVKVRSSDGTLVNTNRLSDGEKHVVALSFLGGIKESTSEGTLIMDSPFGRLDQTHKTRLINRIGDLAEQVVLLVTDEDIDPMVISHMKNVQRSYVLIHDQLSKISKVVDRERPAENEKNIEGDPHLQGLMTLLSPETDWDHDDRRGGA